MAALSALVPVMAQKQSPAGTGNASIGRNLEIFSDVLRQLDIYYVDTLNADSMVRKGINRMLMQVDPFTEYYADEDMDELKTMATGKYAGIGSVIRFSKKENRVVISAPYEGSPSQLAGVRPGDVIQSIDGRDVKGMGTPEVSNLLRGEAGTTFELVVKRPGTNGQLSFKITRKTIQMPQVPYYGMVEPGVGYILLTGFTDGAAMEVRHAMNELRAQGMRRLVLDLRENPGGSVDEAVDIVNMFVPKGNKVVYTKGKLASSNHEYYTSAEPIDVHMPMAVLVSSGSASASEIVSGSLQDMDRAVIIGTRTYGKGLVQSIHELPYQGSLKITIGRYYIPSGRCIQAYDYRHLREDGSVGTIPDSLTHVFHTRAGREVRDGGGIKPDIEVVDDTLATVVYDVAGSEEMLDFATQYVTEHPTIAPAGEFRLTDAEYESFIKYMQDAGFAYNKRSTEALKWLQSIAEREGFYEGAEAEFKALEAKFATNLETDLRRHRADIVEYLEDEIVRRYYYDAGGVKQQLASDKHLQRALEILRDEAEYNRILK